MPSYKAGRRSPASPVNARRRSRQHCSARPGPTVTNNESVVDTMVERIVARFQPARILLFGSRARGTDNRWSDVDLLVVMEEVADNAALQSKCGGH